MYLAALTMLLNPSTPFPNARAMRTPHDLNTPHHDDQTRRTRVPEASSSPATRVNLFKLLGSRSPEAAFLKPFPGALRIRVACSCDSQWLVMSLWPVVAVTAVAKWLPLIVASHSSVP